MPNYTVCLYSLGALAINPLAHVRRAPRQFDALLFAVTKETNHRDIH